MGRCLVKRQRDGCKEVYSDRQKAVESSKTSCESGLEIKRILPCKLKEIMEKRKRKSARSSNGVTKRWLAGDNRNLPGAAFETLYTNTIGKEKKRGGW